MTNRKTKDTVFTKLFSEPKYALKLYKVFHPEDKRTTEKELKILTLENIFSNGEHNDFGLLVNNRLILFVEAQSSWNGNMAIRSLFYLSETYKRFVIDHELDIMGSRAVKLPRPEIYVIYTGNRKNLPTEMKFSEHFEDTETNLEDEKKFLELKIKMIYNSTEGDIVYQYINFCKIFNLQMLANPNNKEFAIKETIKICKNKELLKEYIKKHEAEVYSIMSDFIWNEELLNEIHFKSEMRYAREEGYTDGFNAGINEGHNKAKAEIEEKEARIAELETRLAKYENN